MELKYLIKFFQIRLGRVAVAKFNMKFFFIQICIVSDCTNSFNFPYTNWCFTLKNLLSTEICLLSLILIQFVKKFKLIF